MADTIEHHRGVLPHHQEERQLIAINWRLAFTLPRQLLLLLDELHEIKSAYQTNPGRDGAKEVFLKDYAIKTQLFDEYLGKCAPGEINLCAPEIGAIMADSLAYYNNVLYDLHAWCLMSNHIHILLEPLADESLTQHKTSEIVKKLKTYSAKEINKALNRSGAVWQHEYYDRYIRDRDDYFRTVSYILDNPVKAGLVKQAEDWEFSYYQAGLVK